MVWSGIFAITGGPLTAVTVKVAASEAERFPGSLTVKVMVSRPFHTGSGIWIVATRVSVLIDTVRLLFPLTLQVISASVLSASET
ncbi:MAG: hypothetical protein KCHDKBKB_00804 [Elusimicrobia bacterium]|nr:hypothetical protein [Elusimicrobiota bacterium]